MIIMYSKKECVYCVSAKSLLEFKKDAVVDGYKIIMVPDEISYEDFKNKYPNVRTFPYILENDTELGGFQDLQKRLLEKEMENLTL